MVQRVSVSRRLKQSTRIATIMSNPLLSSFDPFALHPFTAGTSQTSPSTQRPPHSPSSYDSSAAKKPSVAKAIPSSHPPVPVIQSPQPQLASGISPPSSSASQPIFTPFKLDRASPELSDVLAKKKKSPAFWPAKATCLSTKGPDALGTSGGQK